MKGKERFKIMTIMTLLFTLVTRSNCDFWSEVKMSLQILQDTVDKISLEQIRTNEKVDKLQNEVNSLSLDMNSRLDTLDDLREANKKTSLEQARTNEKLDQLQNEVKSISLDMNLKPEFLDVTNNKTLKAIDKLNIKMKTSETNCCNGDENTIIDTVNQDKKSSTTQKVDEEKGKP